MSSIPSLSHSKLEIAGNSMKFQKSYQKSVWISQTCGKQKSGIPRTLPKKVWIPMQNCRKRYGFQCKMVKKKYGIPMSSIGGGSLLSGIAQCRELARRPWFSVVIYWTMVPFGSDSVIARWITMKEMPYKTYKVWRIRDVFAQIGGQILRKAFQHVTSNKSQR